MKKWYASKTIIGAGITMAALALSQFGINVGAEDLNAIIEIILKVFEFGGTLLAIYGRVKASKPIGK